MQPLIITTGERYFVGMRITTRLADDATGSLWRAFMPRRKEVMGAMPSRYYSIQLYADFYMLTPQIPFEKWAAVQVPERNRSVPPGMEVLTVPQGTYAQFTHKGVPSGFSKTLAGIVTNWLPHSSYELDGRPHMEVMDEYYDPNDPESEEEVWIPVKLRV